MVKSRTETLTGTDRRDALSVHRSAAGRTVAHVYSDTAPGPGFEPSEPDLEDVYFSTMAGGIGRRREQPESEPRS